MNTEPRLISVVGERPLPKYYVYYDEWTGEIINITNKYKASKNPHLLTEDNTAAGLLMGHLNPKKFIVNETPSGIFLMLKQQQLRLKQEEDQLSKISEVSLSVDREINIIKYTNSWKLEVNISNDAVYKMTGRRNNRQFSKKENVNNSTIYFYITEKNNPLRLIKTIKIDPIDLLNKGYKLFDLSDLQNVIGLNNIDILTRRVFKSYGLKSKENYVSIEYLKRKNSRRNHYNITNINKEAAFYISKSTAGWIFKSNFDDPHEFKIYRDLKIYITGITPFDLRDTIVLPVTELGKYNELYVNTDADLLTSKLLIGEEGKYLSFNYEELEYVKPGKY